MPAARGSYGARDLALLLLQPPDAHEAASLRTWLLRGFDLHEARAWIQHGFDPDHAFLFRSLALDAETTANLRTAGLEDSALVALVEEASFAHHAGPEQLIAVIERAPHLASQALAWLRLGATTAQVINEAKLTNRRVIAVGTTTVRVLESIAAENQGRLVECEGLTRIFIYPPYSFKIADALLTNFHLPRSTLLMLVSAFAAPGATGGNDIILSAYAKAICGQYRFYSYGDAMLIL